MSRNTERTIADRLRPLGMIALSVAGVALLALAVDHAVGDMMASTLIALLVALLVIAAVKPRAL